jgi:D-alanine-D-alanine ligase
MPVCPAPLAPDFRAELETVARRAHQACGGRDYSRIDVRLKDGRPMILDVNINCAVSENSGFVDTARIMGWDYATVLDKLLMMAAKRMNYRAFGFRHCLSP